MTADDAAFAALRAEAHALCADERFAALLRAYWPEFFPPTGRGTLVTRIHADDQMLLHSLRHHRDAGAAVSQYYNVALQQYQAARQIVDATFPPAGDRVALLDFACGFGRLLRFLVCCDRDLELTASEIQDDALRFVADTFGVPTVRSSMQPEAFDPGRRFDVIWVASLFSHLPQALFQRWLARLHALLTPRGVLCFSVHGDALVPPGDVMPAHGLLFKPQSENPDLDAQDYGTAYVTEAFVRGAVARAAGDGLPVHRLPKALAHEQDVYVVAAGRGRDLSGLSTFRRGPWGWVDEHRVVGGALVLRGWAASIDDGALPAVTIRIDGDPHTCPTGDSRPDVRDAFADDRLATSGWALRLPSAPERPRPWVEVTAHTERGETALLYAGWPGGRPSSPGAAHVYR
ncbi:MAG: class I SAM-dependent methyltransferase, partial [Rubrivivax sp.]|nr:class I SAM-dependent methyltransferase [Rubrivivax sp.]